MKPAVARWLELAEVDLKAAKTLMNESDLSPIVCFQAQQSVEKCLKALIEDRKLNPPKSHDLLMLYGKVDDAIDLDEDTLATLNQVYIDSRYPASLGSLPEGLPDVEDAKEFFEFAVNVLSQVKTILQTQ